MASTPGVLTDWPWKSLGSFKYVLLAPWIISSTHSFLCKDENERDVTSFLVFPFIFWRMIHNQIWISLSRYQTAKGNNRIVDKGLEFEQVDRERNWDDQILFNAILFYVGIKLIPGASNLPLWRTEGVIISILLHAGPVEFLYYWLHRALHHHYLYSRYHSHHHSSIVTEPITFLLVMSLNIDFMNNMGHCNFEFIPKRIFTIFPLLKYLMYTPSFHSLHHTQFRTNYTLFMPLYDYIYGTMDKSTDSIYESSLKREQEAPDVVHLTHLTTLDSIYHLQVGFANFAYKPYKSKWYFWLMWPVTLWSLVLTWVYSRMFMVERHRFDKLRLQTWAIPKYTKQGKGTKVLSLGLLNQSEELNRYGELYVQRHPKLKTKVVDGSSLAVAVVLNSKPTKVAYAILYTLYQKGIQVIAQLHEEEFVEFNTKLDANSASNLNWLPRRVMSAWRIAGIVHALEGWNEHECGDTISNIDQVWEATLRQGFQPILNATQTNY
ncbi:hypothetical protein UlMin_036850 [Ulmus minor]